MTIPADPPQLSFVAFPDLENASDEGLLAMGGDLSSSTLLSAYAQGIFPWYNQGQPILWWSPDPRLVLYPNKLKISRSLAKTIRQQRFRLSCDVAFDDVIEHCALRGQLKPFSAQPETWITVEMKQAYQTLRQLGYAHSIEVWQDHRLVGGLYGVVLGKLFFGESMFSTVSDASKVALCGLCSWLIKKNFELVDCQVSSDHLLSLGAEEVHRSEFVKPLSQIDLQQPSKDFSTGFQSWMTVDHLLQRTSN